MKYKFNENNYILLQQLFYEPISGHAFNADLTQIVVSNSTPHTHVMKRGADGKLVLTHVLL